MSRATKGYQEKNSSCRQKALIWQSTLLGLNSLCWIIVSIACKWLNNGYIISIGNPRAHSLLSIEARPGPPPRFLMKAPQASPPSFQLKAPQPPIPISVQGGGAGASHIFFQKGNPALYYYFSSGPPTPTLSCLIIKPTNASPDADINMKTTL